jgi:hypothetical protein
LRREVGEDLHEFITIDEVASIHENAPSGEGDGDGKKRKKKDKGKGKEQGRLKAEEERKNEDQEFLMKYVHPKTSRISLRN